MNLNELRDRAYKIACDHGFHDKELSNEHWLCLVISELMEAVEADRKGKRANAESYKLLSQASIERTGNPKYFNEVSFNHHIKDTVEDELADAVIRLLDLAGLRNIDLDTSYKEMIEYLYLQYKDNMTFTEHVFQVSMIPEKYAGTYEFDSLVNDMICAIFGLAQELDIDLMWHIEQKMKYNQLREKMHGKKY